MQVGDILTGDQLDGLPRGSVVVHDEAGGSGFNTVVRTSSGFSWIDQSGDRRSHHVTHALGGIVVDDWTLVHLPAMPLKVGDTITTEEQADALPVGTVVVDTEGDPVSAPAIKIEGDRWLFRNVGMASGDYAYNETVTDHRIVYIPSADTGAVRTAA